MFQEVNIGDFKEGYLQNPLLLNSDNFSVWGTGLILLKKKSLPHLNTLNYNFIVMIEIIWEL